MRIHTDKLFAADIAAAARRASAGGHGTVTVVTCEMHNSRKRDHAIEVRLAGDGIVKGNRTMDGEDYAATWDSWGWFLGHLFTLDPNMVAGADDGEDAFHGRTGYIFDADQLPDELEPAPAPAVTWADGHGVWHVKVLTALTVSKPVYIGGATEHAVNIKGVASRALRQELTARSYSDPDPRCYRTPVKVGTEGAYTIFRERVPQFV